MKKGHWPPRVPLLVKRHEKHRASKSTRVNPLSVTLAEGAPSSANELVTQGTSSTLVTFANVAPAGDPLSTISKGVAMPITEEEVPGIYRDGEDPEIEALFKEFELLQTAGNASPPVNVETQGSEAVSRKKGKGCHHVRGHQNR